MQETQKQEIARALTAYQEENGLSNEALGRFVGLSGAYIGYLLKAEWNQVPGAGGKVVSITDATWRKVQAALGLTVSVVPTRNYQDVVAACAKAKREARCLVVDGATGAGKTFALEQFKRQHPAGTYLVTSTTRLSAQDFVERLAEAVGVSLSRGRSQVAAVQAIAEKLLAQRHPVLLLDELETAFEAKNPKAIFGLIKDLQRETAGRLGIVLVGAGLWARLLEKVKWNSGSFPQLVSRFEQVPPVLLGGIGREDEEEVGRAFGLGGRKGLHQALAALPDQRPCKNYRDLIGRLEEMQTVERIVDLKLAA